MSETPDLKTLQQMSARFAPTKLAVDVSRLSAGDRKALVKLIEAAHVVDEVFLKQYWSGDTSLWNKLKRDETPLGRAQLHYFWLNKGPWSALDEQSRVSAGGAGAEAAGGELLSGGHDEGGVRGMGEDAIAGGSGSRREGFFTVIHRAAGIRSRRCRYSEEYAGGFGTAGEAAATRPRG